MQESQASPHSRVMQRIYQVPSRSLLSNLAIGGISLGLLVWSFHLVRDKFVSVTSTDAVINGVLTEIKAPQEGIVSDLTVNTGGMFDRGKPFLTLENKGVSQLQVESIKGKLSQQKMELRAAEAKLSQQQVFLQTLVADQKNQHALEMVSTKHSVEQVSSELKGLQARLRLAQVNYDRTKYLRSEGATSQSILDTAAIEVEERQAEVNSLEKQLKVLQANQRAAQLELSLVKTTNNTDPRLRLEAVQMQIEDQRQVIQALRQRIPDTEAELAQAKADVRQQRVAVVNAPTSGVVWRLTTQPGSFVQRGESLGQLLDCSRRWVDTFVEEQAVRSLQPGTPATITLYGSNSQTLKGSVSTIRPGSGRLAAGEDIAIPSTPNMPRKAQVRVELEPDRNPADSGRFCYVGYTAQVSFKIR